MTSFSAVSSIRSGWGTFKERPWFFVGVSAGLFFLYSVLSWATEPDRFSSVLMVVLMGIASLVIGIVSEIFIVNIVLASSGNVAAVTLEDGMKKVPFIQYALVKIVSAIVTIVGLILLIVPGVIAALALMFGNYLVLDKNLPFVDAMKESVRITKGHRLQLLFLVLLLVIANAAGALLLFIGLLVTMPVSLLSIAHAYRTLETSAGARSSSQE